MISSQTQVNLDVNLEYIKRHKKMSTDKDFVEGLIERICEQFKDANESMFQMALHSMEIPPLTLIKCQLLRAIIDEKCMVVPDEINRQTSKDPFGNPSSVIFIAKKLTVEINEKSEITVIDSSSSAGEARISKLTQVTILAISQMASNALNRYTKTLEYAAQRSNRQMENHFRTRERDVLIQRPSSSQGCCIII